MNRSIIFAAVIISGAILLNGYFDRLARAPHAHSTQAAEKHSSFPDKSIAVLPFEDMTGSGPSAHLADGLQDEVLTDLAKRSDLKVISRTSVLQYKNAKERNLSEIGRELGVSHLLEGSVMLGNNDRVRVNVQLIEARTGNHLWADTFDRNVTDVFAIEQEIAKGVADQIGAIISRH